MKNLLKKLGMYFERARRPRESSHLDRFVGEYPYRREVLECIAQNPGITVVELEKKVSGVKGVTLDSVLWFGMDEYIIITDDGEVYRGEALELPVYPGIATLQSFGNDTRFWVGEDYKKLLA